jgi:hypothetical protein
MQIKDRSMNGLRIAALGVCLVMGLGVSAAQAQHFSLHLGHGGHGHGHHHHHRHHHHGWHADWCYDLLWPRPYYERVYVVPQPVVQERVTVIQPQGWRATDSRADLAPSATTVTVPSPAPSATTASIRPNSLPAYRGSGVTINNPGTSGISIAYTLDGRSEVELAPGRSQSLKEKASYVIEFDRGGNFGSRKYELSEGNYNFEVTSQGWELVRAESQTTQTAGAPVLKRNVLPAR